MQNKISLIIPGYNEEAIVKSSIFRLEEEMKSLGRPYNILVVDDGSTDNTSSILREIARDEKFSHLRVVTYSNGPSRRENLTKSFKFLDGDLIVLLDMDLAMPPKHIREMIYWLENGFDIVLANRYHKKSLLSRKINRFVISKSYNAIIRILFRTGIKDNICGFKAFKKEIISKLVSEAGVDKTATRGVFWDTEIVIRALRNKMKIKQIPIQWKEGKKTALNIKRESKMIPYILKFWLRF